MSHQSKLYDILKTRILVMDGAMGTMLQARNLTADDFGGPELEGCNENLVITRPDVIRDIHEAYLKAGSDIIETNTFGGTPVVLGEYDLQDKTEEINKIAARLAKEACQKYSTPEKPRFVAGSMGPTTKAISVTGGITFPELIENFYLQAKYLLEEGVDILLLETAQDTRNVKAGLIGIDQAFSELNLKVPIMVSGTIEPMGTMLGGQTADSFLVSVSHADLFSIGLNCATGPEFMTDHIRSMHELSPWAISCYPNAGLPDEDGKYLETPETLAAQLEKFVDHGWINIIGGCCGTTDKHIAAISKMVEGKTPRQIKSGLTHKSFYSGIELVESTEDNRPLIIGERTNVIGSRMFKRLVNEEKWDEATDIARRQVRNGAQVIDVCLQSTDRDEIPDIDPFYELIIKKIKTPLMIDTTDPVAIEKALTYCQGKSIINSINLEDGEEKFKLVCPIIKKYGAAIVVGTIDEDPVQAQAFTRERKLEIAARSHDLLTQKYKIPEEDIIFDPLVFPCATGDENYIGGTVETVEGLRLIKEKFPYCRTTLGISNISFGLPANAREVVNAVFLYHCTNAGLDTAIVNSEKLERYAQIPQEEKNLAENLLFNYPSDESEISRDWREQSESERAEVNQDNIAKITAFYRQNQTREKKVTTELPLDERLANYILEGSKDGLIPDLDLKLQENIKPLEIINGPLMAGMSEVGRLFNNNELIVAEVLQSAEAMKAAVSHLEQFMEKADAQSRGKVMLATVKGDVHDIGKNLVEIILANNGYEVINLGIKVPSNVIIEEYKKHKPDIIGLSGLLVKSAQQMTIAVEDFKEAGIQIPVLVGGAALSDKFTYKKIAPRYTQMVIYAKDAMTGLDLANQIMNQDSRKNLEEKIKNDAQKILAEENEKAKTPKLPESIIPSSKVSLDIEIPNLPYGERKVRSVPQLEEIWNYINPMMLYVRHLGFKGNFSKKLTERDPKALSLKALVDEVKEEAQKFMKIKAVWSFFEVEAEDNQIHLFEPGTNNQVHTFKFKRQLKEDGLCLSDYVLPAKNGKRDQIAIFVVGAGEGIKERSEKYKADGEYLKSHALQSLAIETAEGCAEWLHRRIREDWGFPDDHQMSMKDRFTTKYRGKRYSFGYPACPNLEDQQGIWKLISPEEIGVNLTEGDMMEPEASVSALVFHHPDCVYFGVGQDED